MHFTGITAALILSLTPLIVNSAPAPNNLKLSPKNLNIPLGKRSQLTNPDGSANVELLKNHLSRTTAKISRGLQNYELNTGFQHATLHRHAPTTSDPNSPNLVIDSKRADEPNSPPPLPTNPDSISQRKGAISLGPDRSASLWYGEIEVGNPAEKYIVDFDTGSSDLWLPGPNCRDTNCQGHKVYDPATSGTSYDLGRNFTIRYGDGSTVSGDQYNDQVVLGNLTASNQTLGAATQYSSDFSATKFVPDGLLGMGYQSLSVYNSTSVFETLVAQGAVEQPVFAFRLSTGGYGGGSELTLGGLNENLYQGNVTYVPVQTQAYWQVNIDGVTTNSQPAVNALPGIIDTGTTIIVGNNESVSQLYASVPGARSAAKEIQEGFYTVPCGENDAEDAPVVGLVFGGKKFEIAKEMFTSLGRLRGADGEVRCVGGVIAAIGEGARDVFLRNVYTVFDFGQNRVGFADLVSDQSISDPTGLTPR